MAFKIKQEKTAPELESARARLEEALQFIIEKADESPSTSEDESNKLSEILIKKEPSPVSSPTKRPAQRTQRKRRRKDEGLNKNTNSYVMKLFDRAVDLTPFTEQTLGIRLACVCVCCDLKEMEENKSSIKLRKCIINSWKLVGEEFKKYLDHVKIGEKHLVTIIGHKTTLKSVTSTNIEDTELIQNYPDIHVKLQDAIQMEIFSDESLLKDVIDILHGHFSHIIVQIDKIFNVYESQDFSLNELTKSSEMSASFAEMLEDLDRFKSFFIEDHHGRKETLYCLHRSDDLNKIYKLWETSDLESMKKDLDLILVLEEDK